MVLNSVSMKVSQGEIALVLGPSGVGKSTLLRIVAGLESADSGTIILGGNTLELAKSPRGNLVGMVFQNFNLFEHMTVLENITFPLTRAANLSRPQAETRAIEILEKYQLSEKATMFAGELSGGQKQRLAIARTVALSPKVICLDEPTSALDPLLTSYVAHMIQELAQQGYTVLVSSHDTHLITKLPCSLYLMKDGQITETAQSRDFKANPDLFSKLKNFVEGHFSE